MTIQRGSQQTLAVELKRTDGSPELTLGALTSATFRMSEQASMATPMTGPVLGTAVLNGQYTVEFPQTSPCVIATGLYFGQVEAVFSGKTYRTKVFEVKVAP